MARQLGREGEERAPAGEGPAGREGVVAEAELQAGRGVDDGEALGEDLHLGDAREQLGILGAQAREEPGAADDPLLGRRGARRVEDDEAGRAGAAGVRPRARGRPGRRSRARPPAARAPPARGARPARRWCRGRRGARRPAPPTGATRGSAIAASRSTERSGRPIQGSESASTSLRCGSGTPVRTTRRTRKRGCRWTVAQAAAALPPSRTTRRTPRTTRRVVSRRREGRGGRIVPGR